MWHREQRKKLLSTNCWVGGHTIQKTNQTDKKIFWKYIIVHLMILWHHWLKHHRMPTNLHYFQLRGLLAQNLKGRHFIDVNLLSLRLLNMLWVSKQGLILFFHVLVLKLLSELVKKEEVLHEFRVTRAAEQSGHHTSRLDGDYFKIHQILSQMMRGHVQICTICRYEMCNPLKTPTKTGLWCVWVLCQFAKKTNSLSHQSSLLRRASLSRSECMTEEGLGAPYEGHSISRNCWSVWGKKLLGM